jgi:hypothetical protein
LGDWRDTHHVRRAAVAHFGDYRALFGRVGGPPTAAAVLGHQVVELLPVPAIASQLRTVIGMLTCADELVFGITADYDAAPDIDSVLPLRHKRIAVSK